QNARLGDAGCYDAAVGEAGAKGEAGLVVFSGIFRGARDLRTTVDARGWGTDVSCHWPARSPCLRNGFAGASQIVRADQAAQTHRSDRGRPAEDIAAANVVYHACLRGGGPGEARTQSSNLLKTVL